jgi:tetratricopeptide (TPR) repeat protein
MIRRLILPSIALWSIPLGAQAHHGSERLGSVHFPTSCDARAVTDFDRSVALLHSFEFGDAIKGFQRVLSADSTCAMAYWGIALSRWSNPMAAGNRSPAQLAAGLQAISAGRRHLAAATPRERGYIDAVGQLYDSTDQKNQAARVIAYSKAMEALAASIPADTEATIFYAISLVAAASPTDKSYASQKKAGAILEALWRKQPQHPGLAHYIIHAYDYPALASTASSAAREYAVIAPSAAHALHMPSHIFTRTGQWQQSVATNMRSMEVAERTASIAEALHAADYAVYANLQMGNYAAAKKLLEKLPALAARFDVNAITGAAPGSAGVFALAAIPARYALEREAWNDAAALEPHSSTFPWTDAMTYFAVALGAARTNQISKAQRAVDSLGAISTRLATKNEPYWSEQVAIQQLGARAWVALRRGQRDSAEALMRQAVAREDATEKNAVTPGPLAPARELLGDMLMELGRPADALAEYTKSLQKEPGRRHSLRGVDRARKASRSE